MEGEGVSVDMKWLKSLDITQIASGLAVAAIIALAGVLWSVAPTVLPKLNTSVGLPIWGIALLVAVMFSAGAGLFSVLGRRRPFRRRGGATELVMSHSGGDSGLIGVELLGAAERLLLSELPHAARARVLTPEYRTIGRLLSEKSAEVQRLRCIELSVYALEFVTKWHPTLGARPLEVEEEWVSGISETITALLDVHRFPNLERVDLRVVSKPPQVVGIQVEPDTGVRTPSFLLYAAVPGGIPLAAAPAMVLAGDEGNDSATSALLYHACANVIEQVGCVGSPMWFPIYRRGALSYRREHLDAFLAKLRTVVSESELSLPTARFVVSLQADREELPDLGITVLSSSAENRTDPESVFRAFSWLRENGRSAEFRAAIQAQRGTAALSVGALQHNVATYRVDGKHVFAAFVLLTYDLPGGLSLMLIEHSKRPWEYDVPGGKMAQVDTSIEDTAEREVFEELGLIIDRARLSPVLEWKYDKRSQKEGEPVVAGYLRYTLHGDEYVYLNSVLEHDERGSLQHRVVPYDVKRLIAAKRARRFSYDGTEEYEAVCHAPLEAIERLAGGGSNGD